MLVSVRTTYNLRSYVSASIDYLTPVLVSTVVYRCRLLNVMCDAQCDVMLEPHEVHHMGCVTQ